MPIEWDVKKQCWSLSPAIHRQRVDIDNNVCPLRTVPAKGFDPEKFDSFVDRLSPAAIVPEVYVVEKVVDMRVCSGEASGRWLVMSMM